MKKLLLTACLSVLFLNLNLSAEAGEVHEHGVVNITVSVASKSKNKTDIEIDIDSPSINFLGFEHTPKTKEEKKKFKTVMRLLKKGNKLFNLGKKNNCKLKKSTAEKESGHEEGHSDIEVAYSYQCGKKIKNLDFKKWFKTFPKIEEIEVKWLVNKKSGFSELKKSNTKIIF